MTKRMSALIAGGAAAVSVVALATPALAAAGTTSASNGAVFITADWLENELPSTYVMQSSYVDGAGKRQYFDDYGLTVDVANGLIAAGGHGPTVLAIRSAIVANEGNYTGSAWGDFYAGAGGKAATLEQVGGSATPALLTAVSDSVATEAPILGRIQDTSAYGDYANVFGQAFAVQALHAAGDPKAASATTFLLEQQCSAGFFREQFTADKASDAQSCDAASGTASIDTTAQAIISLLPQRSDAAVSAALTNAINYLISVQQADGSFQFSGTGSATSTGLSAYALGRFDKTAEATKAAAWIKANVLVTPGLECANEALVGEYGAVAKDVASLGAAKADGVTDDSVYSFDKATSGALMGLTYLATPYPPTTTSFNNPTYVKAGTPTTIPVGGLATGEDNCLYSQSGATKVAGGKATVLVAKGRESFLLDHFGPQGKVVIGALGTKTFTLALAAGTNPTPAGPTYIVRTSGLAPFESYSLYYRGTKVASGRASSIGAVKATFGTVGPNTAGAIAFKGQYGDIRNGYAYLR